MTLFSIGFFLLILALMTYVIFRPIETVGLQDIQDLCNDADKNWEIKKITPLRVIKASDLPIGITILDKVYYNKKTNLLFVSTEDYSKSKDIDFIGDF